MKNRLRWGLCLLVIPLLFGACGPTSTPGPIGVPAQVPLSGSNPSARATATRLPFLPPLRDPNAPLVQPTPDPRRVLPTQRANQVKYTVQANDTLARIALRYGVTLNQIIQANQLTNPDRVFVGQVLSIPPPQISGSGPSNKIIPDSELVYGPAAAYYDLLGFLNSYKGFLSTYQEEVDKVVLTGAEVVEKVARDYSVSPRLLLALLEYQSGWVTQANPQITQVDFPMRYADPNRKGLYRQLNWAANTLNRGYYLWKVNALSTWTLPDGAVIAIDPTLNAGTAAIQYFFSQLYNRSAWEQTVRPDGFFAAYQVLFGYPFDEAVEPLLPKNLAQPAFQLPFETEKLWFFTGGPHGGWGDGSAWAALDFAPHDTGGCTTSQEWVVAAAPGLITRAENGAVVQDLDADGIEQTGWSLLYMHIESRERVFPGTYVKTGDRIGHPSCEGGVSNGSHVHFARRYNGEWISADGSLPFNLDGWVANSTGSEYNGELRKNGQTIEAWEVRKPQSQIRR